MEGHGPQAIGNPDGRVATDHAVCRYTAEPGHVCANSQGGMLREGQACHAESSQQLQEVLAASVAVDTELARQDAIAADADARLEACERWEEEVA